MTEHRRVVAVLRMRESIAGRSVVLVDDFVISGATLATQSSVLSAQFHRGGECSPSLALG